MEKRVNVQHNRVYHLADTMIMHGKYNSDQILGQTDNRKALSKE